jgi:MFS superfamily sulfate permease-like transporter
VVSSNHRTGLMGLIFADSVQYIAAVAMLAFLSGLLLLLARAVKLGCVVNFISESVLIGFQIGLALYVIVLQMGKVLGISGASGLLRVDGPIMFPNAARVRQEVKRMVKERAKWI